MVPGSFTSNEQICHPIVVCWTGTSQCSCLTCTHTGPVWKTEASAYHGFVLNALPAKMFWRTISLLGISPKQLPYIWHRSTKFNMNKVRAGTGAAYLTWIIQNSHFDMVQYSTAQIAKFMGPIWGPSGSCRPQMGPMLAPWTLLSGWAKHSNESCGKWRTLR